jgi:hypothetical protein
MDESTIYLQVVYKINAYLAEELSENPGVIQALWDVLEKFPNVSTGKMPPNAQASLYKDPFVELLVSTFIRVQTDFESLLKIYPNLDPHIKFQINALAYGPFKASLDAHVLGFKIPINGSENWYFKFGTDNRMAAFTIGRTNAIEHFSHEGFVSSSENIELTLKVDLINSAVVWGTASAGVAAGYGVYRAIAFVINYRSLRNELVGNKFQ